MKSVILPQSIPSTQLTGNALPTALTEQLIDLRSPETIEIVTANPLDTAKLNEENIGIELDENLILKILLKSYEHVKITEISSQEDLDQMAIRKPDLVFSGVKYFNFNGHDLWLNDFLDRHKISYMASSAAALNNEFDKARAKQITQKAGIATVGFFLTAPGEHPTAKSIPIPFPLFVKPVRGGDSEGVDANSVVHDFASFERKVLDIHLNQMTSALVETYLSGREYSVGILEDAHTGTLRTMPVELIAAPNQNGDRILDYDIKRKDSEAVEPVTDLAVRVRLDKLAKAAFRALDGKSLGRIDIKMDHKNVPHFIEANLMPGLTMGYFYRGCQLNLNMNYEEMILTIAKNGLLT